MSAFEAAMIAGLFPERAGLPTLDGRREGGAAQ